MLKLVKMIVISLLTLIVVLVLTVVIFQKTAPQFGRIPGKAEWKTYESSEQFRDKLFYNIEPTSMDWSVSEYVKMFWKFFTGGENREPSRLLPQKDILKEELELHTDSLIHLRWFGHSAFYMEIDGNRLLLDPMLGDFASPISFMGSHRFNSELPIEIEELPDIDAVIYSHDHYDHLDYSSVMKLKNKVGHWFVPLGLDCHLKEWGIKPETITTMDWWDETEFNGLKLACTPARHFSGRKFGENATTLWASWVIAGQSQRLFFSGDGGYTKSFKDIGEKYGPFDLCLIECGAYNEMWHNIHMMPEESAQACLDLKGDAMMPIHWGAFNLAFHSWTDPIERVTSKAKEIGVNIIHPIIGEEIVVPRRMPKEVWWP